jgi:tRNA (guanine37-N1)-methyltransferase
MKISVMTLFPEMIGTMSHYSIMGRAQQKELVQIEAINIRDFATNKHKQVDDYPYGGGAGMLMMAEPVYLCYQHIASQMQGKKPRVVYLTPQGKVWNQTLAKTFSKEDHLVFLCGHYEGIDQRVLDEIVTDEISIGDYVLTGGELGALVLADSIVRLIPGVLGQNASFEEESFSDGLLEYPHYTRPSEFLGKQVPAVLLSGNHAQIETYRKEQSLVNTVKKRPDLLERATLSQKDKKFIEEYRKTHCK